MPAFSIRSHFMSLTDYTFTTDKTRFDVKAIHAFLTSSYWGSGVPIEVVERAILNSLCVGIFHGDVQVGFGRVVTDKAAFAYLADVYVVEAHRGKGLAKRMLELIRSHPDLKGLRRFMLSTKDAHGLYAQFGFKKLANPDRLMEIFDPDVYKR